MLEIELKRATAEYEDSDEDIVFIEEKKTNKVIEEIILTEDEDNAENDSHWEESIEGRSPLVKSEPFSEDEEYEQFDLFKDQEPHEEDEFVFINDLYDPFRAFRNETSDGNHLSKSHGFTPKKESNRIKRRKKSNGNIENRCRYWTLLFLGFCLLFFGFAMIYQYIEMKGGIISFQSSLEKISMQERWDGTKIELLHYTKRAMESANVLVSQIGPLALEILRFIGS